MKSSIWKKPRKRFKALALYGLSYSEGLAPYKAKAPLESLGVLLRRREALIQQQVAEKTRRQQVEGQPLVEASIERHLAYLSQELSLLDINDFTTINFSENHQCFARSTRCIADTSFN